MFKFAMDTQLRKSKALPNGTHLLLYWGRNICTNMSLSAECCQVALFPVVVLEIHR